MPEDNRDPLPIWFFVGLILLVYGLLVVGSGVFGEATQTVLAETRPALWWGCVIVVAGAAFLGIGLRGRGRGRGGVRTVVTRPPSFPEAAADTPIRPAPGQRWQVLCGDAGHWRAGLYSPPVSGARDVGELERHDCPEMFLLISGRVTLVLSDGRGGTREVPLEAGRPVLVTAPHSAYCPDGPHAGLAFVVERDSFDTEYREVAGWTSGTPGR